MSLMTRSLELHNILENCLKLVLFVLLAKLMMGQETIMNEDEEVSSSRPTGALLPPKELWYTSPELIEIIRIQGRQRGSSIPSSYNAKDLGKGPKI